MAKYSLETDNKAHNLIKNIVSTIIVFTLTIVICFVYYNNHKDISDFVNRNIFQKLIIKESKNMNLDSEKEDINTVSPTDNNLGDKYVPVDFYANVELVEYIGKVEHIFFHPLVAYPELAFDGDYQSKGMDNYMATVNEFKRVIDELYINNYILIDINSMYEEIKSEDGNITLSKKKLFLPPNKKPIILSIDDMNYYKYMLVDGCVHKLILDENGRVGTYTKLKDGTDYIAYDNEIVPILDEYIYVHPDFSFKGAKGIIGLTGYDGILGYRTDNDSKSKDSEVDLVKPLIAKLKETGWTFASHSYAHFALENANMDKIKSDTIKWKNEVEALIGETNVYLYPYGSYPKLTSEEQKVLVEDGGFSIFCGVGIRHYEKIYTKFAFVDRKNIDGLTLRNRKTNLQHMFDVDNIIDLESRDRMKNIEQ